MAPLALTGQRLEADAAIDLEPASTKATSMKQGKHKAFDVVLTDQELGSPLNERIAAAVRAMGREVGLVPGDAALDLAIEKELSRTVGTWVFDTLVANGIDVKGKRVLDMGAGLGAVSVEAVERKAIPVAVEPGSGWREIAQERLRLAGDGSVVDAIGEDLPFASSSFDIVLSVQVLEHVADPQAYLREAFRVLRPGGYLWLSCENYLCFREKHYQVLWFPLLPKKLGALYLRLRGRPTEFLWKSVTYTTAPRVTRMLSQCQFVFLEERQLTTRIAESPGLRFELARMLMSPDSSAHWIMRMKRVRRTFRAPIMLIAQRPTDWREQA